MQGIPGFRKWLSGYPPLSTICHYREGKKKLKSQRWSQPAMSTRSCAIRGDNPKAIKRIYTYIPGLSVHDSFWPIFWGSEGMDGATASVAHITTLHPSGPVSTWLPRPWDPNDISHLYFTVVIYHMWIYNLCLYQWIYMHHLNPINLYVNYVNISHHCWLLTLSLPKSLINSSCFGGHYFCGQQAPAPTQFTNFIFSRVSKMSCEMWHQPPNGFVTRGTVLPKIQSSKWYTSINVILKTCVLASCVYVIFPYGCFCTWGIPQKIAISVGAMIENTSSGLGVFPTFIFSDKLTWIF